MTFEDLAFHVDYERMIEIYTAYKILLDRGIQPKVAQKMVVNNHINRRELTYEEER